MTPDLPPGFELEGGGGGSGAAPPLPPGFEIEDTSAPTVLRGADAIPGSAADQRRSSGLPAPVAPPPPEPPTFADKITGAVEAGLNLATQLVGGAVGMVAGPVVSAGAGVNEMARRATGGASQAVPNPIEAGGEISQGIAGGLKRMLHGPMNLNEADTGDTATGAKYTEKYVEPALTGMQALTGHAGELTAIGEQTGPAAKQAADAVRETVAPVVNKAGGAVADAAGRVAAKALKVDPELAKVARVATDLKYPIDVRPDQIVENAKFSKLAGQASSDFPFSGSKNESNRSNFTRNVIDLLNPEDVKSTRLTPDVFDTAMRRSGEGIGEITERTPVPVHDLTQGMDSLGDSLRKATEDNRKIVNEYLGDIKRAAEEGDGTINGTRLKEINSQIGTQARANAGNDLGRYLNDLQDVIQDSVERNADPADITPLRDFRRQYAYGKMLEPDVAKTIDGQVNPSSLMARVTATKQGKFYMARAMGGAIGDLAKVGKLIKEPASSGTAERSALYHAIREPVRAAAGVAGGYPLANLYNRVGPKLTRRMLGKREEPPVAKPPAEPTTSPGAGPGTPPPEGGAPGPLGDLTPDWETSPGAGGVARRGEEPGLVRSVDEPGLAPGKGRAGKNAGQEIPAVPGRPDLPESMTTGTPAEVAANERANKAMNEPGAIEARRQQEAARKKPPEPPAGDEGGGGGGTPAPKAPKPPKPPKPLPTGEATEISPAEYAAAETKWRSDHKLGADDAKRAGDVARALQIDEKAVHAAVRQFERTPRAFDREIARINDKGPDHAPEPKQTPGGGEGHAAENPAGERQRTEPAGAPGEQPGAERTGAAGAERSETGATGGQASGVADLPGFEPGDTLSRFGPRGLKGNSWVLREKATGKSVMETSDPAKVRALNTAKYEAVPVGQHLAEQNKKPNTVEIREVPGGFEAHKDGKKIGYLKDNLERGQAKRINENANVDMVKVDKDQTGKGVGRALYEAFNEKHEGRIAPSGKTEPSAWKLWKRNYPEKVDEFVKQEAARIRDGADQHMVVGNITDPEIAQRVTQEAATKVTTTKRVKDADGTHTVVTLPDGSVRRIQRLNSAESMGLPGWHDMDAPSTRKSYIADTEAEAIKEIERDTSKQPQQPNDLRQKAGGQDAARSKPQSADEPEEVFHEGGQEHAQNGVGKTETGGRQITRMLEGRTRKPIGSAGAMDMALRERFGDKFIQGLKDQGILKYDSLSPKRSTIGATFKEGESPAATLYYGRLTHEELPGVLMHELGEHFGIVRLLGHDRYNVMLSELRDLRKTPEVSEAWKSVKERYVDSGAKVSEGGTIFMREVAARLVEDHPNLPFVRRLINEVRAYFYEHFGTTMGNRVDASLVRGLAASALRKASKGELENMTTPVPAAKTFQPMLARRMPSGDTRPTQ